MRRPRANFHVLHDTWRTTHDTRHTMSPGASKRILRAFGRQRDTAIDDGTPAMFRRFYPGEVVCVGCFRAPQPSQAQWSDLPCGLHTHQDRRRSSCECVAFDLVGHQRSNRHGDADEPPGNKDDNQKMLRRVDHFVVTEEIRWGHAGQPHPSAIRLNHRVQEK